MLRLYIPGKNTSRRETFNCKHVFPCLEVQGLRLHDLGVLSELGSKVQRFIILDPFWVNSASCTSTEVIIHGLLKHWGTTTYK